MEELSAIHGEICDFFLTLCAFWGGLCGDTTIIGQNTRHCDIIEQEPIVRHHKQRAADTESVISQLSQLPVMISLSPSYF